MIPADFERLCTKEKIELELRPGMDEIVPPPYFGAFPWTATLKYIGRRIVVPYYAPTGHVPLAAEVLWNLCTEARLLDETHVSWEEWAARLHLNEDSRRAYQSWDKARIRAKKLHDFLGPRSKDFLAAIAL